MAKPPMRIAFDVTSCAKPHSGGIQNFGRSLVRGVARVADGHEIRVAVRPHRWLKRHLVADLPAAGPPRLLLDRFHGMSLGRIDVLHSIGVRLPGRATFARVVTIQDVRVYENPELASPDWVRKRRARIRQTAQRADLIVSPSEQGARALVYHLGLPPDRVRVLPDPVDTRVFQPPDPASLARVRGIYALGERPYLLNLGKLSARKNQLGLLEAFARARLPEAWLLVLAGPSGDDAGRLRARAAALGIESERLRLPGSIPAEDLPALLGGCGAYACSSLHEGFGLPVAEAQACGAAVVSSDRAALPETVGDCGLLFDPRNPEDFAGALRRIAADAELRGRFARRGPARARQLFSAEVVGAHLLDIYREALALRRRVTPPRDDTYHRSRLPPLHGAE